MSFFEQMKNYQVENDNVSITENGAIGYKTTGKKLVDLNFAVASLRNASDSDILAKYLDAFVENPELALRWLFFARDVRGGLGERRLFRVVINNLACSNPNLVCKLVPLIAEYGRYDDLLVLLEDGVPDRVQTCVLDYIKKKFEEDVHNYATNNSVSLLPKWIPSVNSSNKKRNAIGKRIAKYCELTEGQYRKSLSALRKYLDVTEVKMSANKWDKIKYESVPSKANLNYKDAFLRHDEERRKEFLDKVNKGESKINSSVLYPHEIVSKYCSMDWGSVELNEYDASLEALWKNLPDLVNSDKSILVVGDGSGSMFMNTTPSPIYVSWALSIYFAERLKGAFANKYIIFSSRPNMVEIRPELSLRDKIAVTMKNTDCSNTNIEKTFDLILNTAIENHCKQEELPSTVLIISDMEFDSCTYRVNQKTLFKNIEDKFATYGYKMPKLVFWNVALRTGTIPVKENDAGVVIVSGFSTNICKMVLSNKLDPFEILVEQLMNKRYDPISEVYNS